jgi:hypothetical protein
MADPFSTVAAAAGVLDVATRASTRLRDVYSTVANAPHLILALANEVADLRLILAAIEVARAGIPRLEPQRVANLHRALERQLHEAERRLADLDSLIVKFNS